MYYDIAFIRENLDYNPDTGILVWKRPKQGRKIGVKLGRLDKDGYLLLGRVIFENGKKVGYERFCVHRIAWAFIHGRLPENQIDHVNGIKSDNRLCNLREATNAENMRNVGKQSHNTSGLKGVSWHKHTKKWRATTQVNGNQINLGLFDCPAAASFSYQIAVEKYHGSFARPF